MEQLNLELLNQINNGFHPVAANELATIAVLIYLAIEIIAAVLAMLLVPNAYDPRGASDVNVSQQELGRAINVVYGTVLIRNASRIGIAETIYKPIKTPSKK